MVENAFAFIIIATAILFAARNFSSRAGGIGPAWFVACAVIFVALGFLSNSLAEGTAAARTGMTVVSVGLLFFMVGAIAAVVVAKHLRARHHTSTSHSVEADQNVDGKRLMILSVATLGPSWLYFVLLGYVPLFDGVGAVIGQGVGGIGELQASRLSRDSYASNAGIRIPGQGFLQIARNIGVPMLAAYALMLIRSHGRSMSRIIVLALAVVTVLLAGQRWPLLYVGIALAVAMTLSEAKLPVKRILHLGLLITGIGVFVSVLQGRTSDRLSSWGEAFLFAIGDLWGRITYDQVLVPILSYERRTYEPGELLGRSYMDSLLAYAPGPGASFPVEFYMKVTSDSRAYTAPPDFFTEAYINFGMPGVAIFSFLWGVVIALVSNTIVSSDRSLDIALRSGIVSVLALSCFTGPVFTVASGLYAIILYIAATLVRQKEAPADSAGPPGPVLGVSALTTARTTHSHENSLR